MFCIGCIPIFFVNRHLKNTFSTRCTKSTLRKDSYSGSRICLILRAQMLLIFCKFNFSDLIERFIDDFTLIQTFEFVLHLVHTNFFCKKTLEKHF